jgi:hypothetical protein
LLEIAKLYLKAAYTYSSDQFSSSAWRRCGIRAGTISKNSYVETRKSNETNAGTMMIPAAPRERMQLCLPT